MDPPNNPPASSQQRAQQNPVYDTSHGGHYGASAALAAQGYAPVAEFYTGAWANVNQGLHGTYKDILTTYWQHIISHLESETHDYKLHQLPLARIKKVMKADPEVKMISAEAPILFAKGCDIFITELTMRAWIHAEENKRRTLQRSDIASALAKSDMFDFLIDIVPREEAASAKRATGQPTPAQGVPGAPTGTAIPPQHANIPQQPGPQHNMPPPPNYALGGHGLAPDQEYPQQPMYPTPGQPGPGATYGGPGQMYNEMEGMYAYPPMQAQQQMYHVQQRPQDPSVGHDAGHNYSRNDGGEGDADAEGERDYEVG
ncbi:Transcriptional activator [Lachnellula hyalina]|uniref:Transcriptional activator n=1 Tax=Lachnellula hyalina TaxID=1316788 RepID=A0A8H8QWI8_9HELO|nr:Transcriptional activator [Lachnellula hyalina]TVY23010.1 Transcriptional activator [Lachnellula hyalina]